MLVADYPLNLGSLFFGIVSLDLKGVSFSCLKQTASP